MRAATAAKGQRAGSWRSALTLAILLAFSIQSFLIQTHIHALVFAGPQQGTVTVTTQKHSSLPFNPDKCVLCQEFVHAGSYVLPGGIAVLPPSARVSLLPFELVPVIAARAISHTWMGRAPPHA